MKPLVMSLVRPDKSNLTSWALSALIFMGTWQAYNLAHDAALKAMPATDWMEINRVSIPDFAVSEKKVPVIYDRVIHKAFNGRWIVEIHNADSSADVCDGDGHNRYEPDDVLPTIDGRIDKDNKVVELDWLMGKTCVLAPGKYFAKMFIKIHPDDDAPSKMLPYTTGIFKVTADAAQ